LLDILGLDPGRALDRARHVPSVSSDFYTTSIAPFAPIIIKICRAYTNTQEDFEDYYQEVCLQIWRSHHTFDERAAVPRSGPRGSIR
jgi:DNA-directed RNA polymerase specialized sigma24 family protein